MNHTIPILITYTEMQNTHFRNTHTHFYENVGLQQSTHTNTKHTTYVLEGHTYTLLKHTTAILNTHAK